MQKDYHVKLLKKKSQVFRMFRINQTQRLTFHLKRNQTARYPIGFNRSAGYQKLQLIFNEA